MQQQGLRPHRCRAGEAAAEKLHHQRTLEPVAANLTGVLLRDVLAHFGATGTQLQVTALNDYAISIPVDDARLFDVIVAYKIDGQPVAVRDRGPMLVMYPFDARPELQHRRYYERARDLADQGDHGAIAGCSSSGAPSSWRSWWPSAPS